MPKENPAATRSNSGEGSKIPDITGRTLGDFQLVRKLGEGGMGQVYLARQVSLKRQVAIKILRPELAENETALQRFRREAEAVAGINHANIVQIFQIGESDGMHYMALEYVEGRNLRDYLARKGPPDLPIALNIMRQVAAALQRAGEMGFVHRDIKPENILLTRKGEAKVADFGLSRCFATEEPLSLTRSGMTMGTPLYMSPEQVQGRVIDPRSDIYSFGVSCYHLLAGEPPFRGNTAFEVALQHVQTEPPPLADKRPDLPPELCALVHKMMAKNPDARPQTPREILRELARIREGLGQAATAAVPNLAVSLSRLGDGPASPPGGTTGLVFPPPLPTRPKWWLPVGGLALALMVGVAARWTVDPLRPETEPKQPLIEEVVENTYRIRFQTEEKRLLDKIDNKEITSGVSVDAALELLMLYLHEKKFTEAEEFLNSLSKKTKFQLQKDEVPGKPLARLVARFTALHLAGLGKAILASYKDDAVGSNRQFAALFALRDTPKKLEPQLMLEPFLLAHPKWRREVSDAIDRNAKNLNPTMHKLDDPVLEKYRSYLPKLPEMKK